MQLVQERQLHEAMGEMQRRLESGGAVDMGEFEQSRQRIAALTLASPGASPSPSIPLLVSPVLHYSAPSFTLHAPFPACLPGRLPPPLNPRRGGPPGGCLLPGGVGHAGAARAPAALVQRVPPAVGPRAGAQAQVRLLHECMHARAVSCS